MTQVPNAQLTHVGLYVDDMERMVSFYTTLLGMVVSDSGEFLGRHLTFLTRKADEHHQLVLVEGRRVHPDIQLLSQVSFRVDGLDALRDFERRALALGVAGMEGRNHGNSWSIYFEDPEGNRLEVYTATPWHVSQPWRVALDLGESTETIEATTKRLIDETGTSRPVEEWRREMAVRLGQAAAPPERTEDGYRSLWTELRQVAFRQGWVDAAGLSTRYAEAGPPDAPALVMLHGTGGHWETFAANIGPLSKHFHCIAIDMAGNGFSDKPDVDYEIPFYAANVLAVMDAFAIERASLTGTSLGSWVAAHIALKHPERVEKLVLMSTAGLMATADNMARIRNERTKAVDDPSWASIRAMFEHLIEDDRNRLDDLVALRQAIYRLPETKAAMAHVLILQDAEVRDRNLLSEDEWRSIQAPALVIASGKDSNEYTNTSRRVAKLLPNAELLEMPHVKHWPHFEDAATWNEAAIRFLLRDR